MFSSILITTTVPSSNPTATVLEFGSNVIQIAYDENVLLHNFSYLNSSNELPLGYIPIHTNYPTVITVIASFSHGIFILVRYESTLYITLDSLNNPINMFLSIN